MIYTFGHISGAHFNPAGIFAFVLTRHFPLKGLLDYWMAQLVGATLAAGCLRLIFLGMSSISRDPSDRKRWGLAIFWIRNAVDLFSDDRHHGDGN